MVIVGCGCRLPALADDMARSYRVLGTKLPALTVVALHLPPWFYAVALVAGATASLGLVRKLSDNALLLGGIAVLFTDVAILFAWLWDSAVHT